VGEDHLDAAFGGADRRHLDGRAVEPELLSGGAASRLVHTLVVVDHRFEEVGSAGAASEQGLDPTNSDPQGDDA